MKLLKKILGWIVVLLVLAIGGLWLDSYMNSLEHLKTVIFFLIVMLISIYFSKDDLQREIDLLKDRVDQLEYEVSELHSRDYS